MKHLYTTKQFYLLFSFLVFLSTAMQAQKVAYDYDMAGNRISRKVVNLDNPNYAKKQAETPVPVEDQLGERKITVYPNPTKGALAVEMTGGNQKDQMSLSLFSSQGVQLQSIKVTTTVTPVNMSAYPSGYYILRVQAGDKMTEFKIIKQ
jgi:hypothetical protein